VEPEAVEALRANGVSRFGQWLFGILPQVAPRTTAYTLYRFEVNVRMTAMMGFVGAGGIGNELHTAISLFHFVDLAVLLVVMLVVVSAIDLAGDRLRARIIRGPSALNRSRIWMRDGRVWKSENPEPVQGVRASSEAVAYAAQVEHPVRRYKRQPVVLGESSLRLLYRASPDEEFAVAHLRDVSPTGCFICRPDPYPVGSMLELRIEGGSESLDAVAQVVRGQSDTGEPAGIGVAFLEADAEFLKALGAMIRRPV
jgi:hypothetical protein